jgi:hypothetical protein
VRAIKVARVALSECGQRASFNISELSLTAAFAQTPI